MKLLTIVILFIIGLLLFSKKKCIEGYISELTCNETRSDSLTSLDVQNAIITLPDDLSGKFIDIDARDKFYLYAVSDNNEIYRCRKPCKDMNKVLTEVVTVSVPDSNEGNSLYGNSLYIQNNEILQGIQERQEFNDIKIKIDENFYTITQYNPASNDQQTTNITISDGNNLEILVNSRFNVYDLSATSPRIPVSWEKIPMNVSGFDITKIYATPDSNFLWGLNDLGEPVYAFQENDDILTDYKNNLTIGKDAKLMSYSDIGDGYCNNNKIRVNSLIDVLNSEESLEACEELCNSDRDCKYMSYSDNLNICNIYRGDANEIFVGDATYGSNNTVTINNNDINVNILVNDIIKDSDEIETHLESGTIITSVNRGDSTTTLTLSKNLTEPSEPFNVKISRDTCLTDEGRNPNSNFITYKKNEVDVRSLESGLN